MKQFYFLLIIGLTFSGFVLIGPRLKNKDKLLDQILLITERHTALILLALFNFSVGLSNLVWVGSDGTAVLQNLLPSLVLVLAGAEHVYVLFLREYPGYRPKEKFSFTGALALMHKNVFWLGLLCIVMALVHFFAESLLFL